MATLLCICSSCQSEYGSCDLFETYPLVSYPLNKIHLRSDNLLVTTDEGDNIEDDFIALGSVVAVTADNKSIDTVLFIKISGTKCLSNGQYTYDYGHNITHGITYLKGLFPERKHYSTTYQIFNLISIVRVLFILLLTYPPKKGIHFETRVIMQTSFTLLNILTFHICRDLVCIHFFI